MICRFNTNEVFLLTLFRPFRYVPLFVLFHVEQRPAVKLSTSDPVYFTDKPVLQGVMQMASMPLCKTLYSKNT